MNRDAGYLFRISGKFRLDTASCAFENIWVFGSEYIDSDSNHII